MPEDKKEQMVCAWHNGLEQDCHYAKELPTRRMLLAIAISVLTIIGLVSGIWAVAYNSSRVDFISRVAAAEKRIAHCETRETQQEITSSTLLQLTRNINDKLDLIIANNKDFRIRVEHELQRYDDRIRALERKVH